ncbi:type VI secretion system Vgr family protein [Herbaspirillum rubrisubalbicans]|uniref:type VI secretion system Vgr family protein n=1 Tax=Herbaspirillum rubrisubalbicans TaxID=80842 RepID=UPI001559B2A6|nr:type VI secretion system Vgr family protein [Herbaspirillum rubrisubalbicans]NQE49615.1 type VI secretion protein [Herbaspirillum rubrisubalbicans]
MNDRSTLLSTWFQALISQGDRLLRIDSPLGTNALLPQRVVGREHLGRGYEYTIDVVATNNHIELKKLVAEPVTLWIQQSHRDYSPIHGYVQTVRRLGSDGQVLFCQIVVVAWLNFLKYRKDARIWQDKTAEDILAEVFDGHPQARANYRFELATQALPRSYCTQYETDWHFAQRLMEEEGWYSYHEQKPDGSGHVLVITDNTHGLKPIKGGQAEFHTGGTADEAPKIVHWSASRSLSSSALATRTDDYRAPGAEKFTQLPVLADHGNLPGQLEVYEYTGAYSYDKQEQGDRQAKIRVEQWESSMKRFHGVSGVRSLECGRWFSLEGHPAHAQDPAEDRQFMLVAVEWFIENNLPLSNNVPEFPGSLKPALDTFKATISRQEPGRTGENELTGHCFNRFEAQRRKVPFRSPMEHPKPVMHPQTAVVVGPAGEEIYTDKLNRVKVRFRWDRQNPGDERASCWVRVSYPNAGENWGGVHVPRIRQELIISFLNGDPDRPVATGRLFNEEQAPQWHTDGRLSGLKSKEFGGSGFNQLVMDDTSNQNRLQLYSSHANAQLNLGYLVRQVGNERQSFYGSGFSLNTDHYGAIVADKGLYLSTFARPGPHGTQLDTTEATNQLKAGAALTKNLSETASRAGAEPLAGTEELDTMIDATQDSYTDAGQSGANRFKQSVLVAASPSGIGMTTPKGAHVHAGSEVTLSAGENTSIATGKSLLVSAAEKISLFAFKAGAKLFAAKGKVEVQAQSDDLELIAEKVARLLSRNGRVEIHAKDEVVISAGGSFVKINASGITQGTRGAWEAKAATHSMPGPATLAHEMNKFPDQMPFDEEFVLKWPYDQSPVKNRRFEIIRGDGTKIRGVTDDSGKTGLQKSLFAENTSLRLLPE